MLELIKFLGTVLLTMLMPNNFYISNLNRLFVISSLLNLILILKQRV